jgi:hypothetical protein
MLVPEDVALRLRAIRDPRLRARVLIDALGHGDPDRWARALAAAVARAHRDDDRDAAVVVQCLAHATADPALPYATRKRLYEAAVARGIPEIARLFLTASPATAHPGELERQLAPERPLRATGRPLTLGERKALARTHDREQLQLLLRDPHPAVVAILIDNPHLTEADVLRIAAARPAVPAALALIAAHPRWSARHAVRRALVQNPALPLADAIRVATTLRPSDLAELAADLTLPAPLREHAAEVAARIRRRAR